MREQGRVLGALFGSIRKNLPAIQDDLTVREGYQVYRQMLHDPDVKAGLFIKIGGVLTKGWEISPAIAGEALGVGRQALGSDSGGKVIRARRKALLAATGSHDSALDQAEFVRGVFEGLPGSLDERLYAIARDGLAFGTSVAEKVFALDELGRVIYRDIKPKDPALYAFDLDDYNNVQNLRLIGIGLQKELDPRKFPVFAFQSEYGQPWGTSDLRAAYKHWWFKYKFWDFWAMYLEKFGTPTAVGKYRRGLPLDQQKELLKVLDSIQQETAVVVPDDVVVELLEARSASGESPFQSAIEASGKQIIRAILGQTLATDEGYRSGSLSLGRVHQDVMVGFIKHLKRQMEEYVDQKLIRDLCDYNFEKPLYPNFTLLIEDKDIAGLSDAIFKLVTCGEIEAGEPWVRDYLGMPGRSKSEMMGDES
jgi:phage gp29-like protein